LKSVDVKDVSADSFEGVIAMENLQSRVEGRLKAEGSGYHYRDSEDEEKEIMFSTTVEITKEATNAQGHDMG
jgi:hypothetical protein